MGKQRGWWSGKERDRNGGRKTGNMRGRKGGWEADRVESGLSAKVTR